MMRWVGVMREKTKKSVTNKTPSMTSIWARFSWRAQMGKKRIREKSWAENLPKKILKTKMRKREQPQTITHNAASKNRTSYCLLLLIMLLMLLLLLSVAWWCFLSSHRRNLSSLNSFLPHHEFFRFSGSCGRNHFLRDGTRWNNSRVQFMGVLWHSGHKWKSINFIFISFFALIYVGA